MFTKARDFIVNHRILHFLVSGCLSAAAGMATIYILTSLLHVWYLFSTTASFLVTFLVGYILQKHWTFQDPERNDRQAIYVLIFSLINLGLNALLMYVAVDLFGIHYLVSQVIVYGILAIETFLGYK